MEKREINRITRADVLFAKTQGQHLSLDGYQHIALRSAIYPGQGTAIGLMYVALKGAGEAGEFAEHVGKALRDDSLVVVETRTRQSTSGPLHSREVFMGPLTPERRDLLIKEIGDQLWYLAAKCNELGITLSEAARINLEKLCDRQERDALRGSGDDR